MPYEYGQIILVPVADGHGNVEPHPAVILERSDRSPWSSVTDLVPAARRLSAAQRVRVQSAVAAHSGVDPRTFRVE